MSYYDNIEEDLWRAKEILAKGRPAPWETANFTPEVIEALRQTDGGAIFGADIYAAYKLLESFVQEIERLTEQRDAALNAIAIHAAAAECQRQRADACICRTTRCQHGAHLHHNGVCEVCNAGICWC